jgi:hypothetical protein
VLWLTCSWASDPETIGNGIQQKGSQGTKPEHWTSKRPVLGTEGPWDRSRLAPEAQKEKLLEMKNMSSSGRKDKIKAPPTLKSKTKEEEGCAEGAVVQKVQDRVWVVPRGCFSWKRKVSEPALPEAPTTEQSRVKAALLGGRSRNLWRQV